MDDLKVINSKRNVETTEGYSNANISVFLNSKFRTNNYLITKRMPCTLDQSGCVTDENEMTILYLY